MAGCLLSSANAQTPAGYTTSAGGGILRLGITVKGKSYWLNADDTPIRNGQLQITAHRLSESHGVVIAVRNTDLPADAKLAWGYGGCDNDPLETDISPEDCKDNVFNVEGSLITAYHGEVMRLRFTRLIIPVTSEVRLADAHRQQSPDILFESGKATDAPMLCGQTALQKGKTYYFCLYKPGRNADYTYNMLPQMADKPDLQP